VTQARGVLAHLPDAVLFGSHRRAVRVLREQVERILHRLRAEFLLVPQFAVELEEPLWAVLSFGFADEERDVEVAYYFRAALVDRRVAVLEPLPALLQPPYREVRGVTAVLRRVREAVEVAAVKTDLADVGLRVFDEREVIVVCVLGPV